GYNAGTQVFSADFSIQNLTAQKLGITSGAVVTGVFAFLPTAPTVLSGSGAGQHSRDRKSTRLNSSHSQISYAVFCLKKKNAIKAEARVAPSQNPPVPLLLPSATLTCSRPPRAIIGSKNFTETDLLADTMAHHTDQRT